MCLEAPVLNSTAVQWEKGGLHWLTNPVPTLPWAGDKVNPIHSTKGSHSVWCPGAHHFYFPEINGPIQREILCREVIFIDLTWDNATWKSLSNNSLLKLRATSGLAHFRSIFHREGMGLKHQLLWLWQFWAGPGYADVQPFFHRRIRSSWDNTPISPLWQN